MDEMIGIGKHDLIKLTTRDLTFYYWLGFILADGHISNDRLIVQLHNKDYKHLLKLNTYLGISVAPAVIISRNHSRIGCKNKILGAICQEFDINSNKTTNPPNTEVFAKLSRNELLSIFVGFVDGDGCIGNLSKRKDFHLRIKCHSSWFVFLEYLNDTLNLGGYYKIDSCGYALFSISNTALLKNLKLEILNLNLPLLKRKWDNINLQYIGRTELGNYRKEITKQLLEKGFRVKDIAKRLNIKSSTISNIIRRNENIIRPY